MIELSIPHEFFLNPPEKAKLIKFEGVAEKNVFNITSPFQSNGEIFIAGRIESRSIPSDSTVGIFKQKDNLNYTLHNIFKTMELEDPFVTSIKGNLIVGLV